jgi:hypothetical protein
VRAVHGRALLRLAHVGRRRVAAPQVRARVAQLRKLSTAMTSHNYSYVLQAS